MTPFLSADSVLSFGYAGAVDALREALQAGLDVDADPPRTLVPVPTGQLLLMPSSGHRYTGVKVLSASPDSLPRIKGVYILMDAPTLTPLALLDGPALTTLRTPAVSALAVSCLAPSTARLAVFGTGPQAHGHVAAISAIREVSGVTMIGRGDDPAPIKDADIICCATSARTPLFPAHLISPHATVVAVGSHEPDARELPGELMRQASVVVESVPAALREAGDVVQAGVTDLITLTEVVLGRTVPDDRPRVFKSVGMAWEDLVVAAAVYEAGQARTP